VAVGARAPTAAAPVPSERVKTRTLLLLALACGLAIMLAGAVFLFQLVTRDELAAPVEIGAAIDVADMTISVLDADESDGRLVVEVSLGGADADDPAAGFRLIASGRSAAPTESTCAATAVGGSAERCTVTFDTSAADGTSRVLFYDRGEEQARWVLG
jgi:hypothetical protein